MEIKPVYDPFLHVSRLYPNKKKIEYLKLFQLVLTYNQNYNYTLQQV